MRLTIASTLLVGAILATTSASAQTYDPNYPVCIQTYSVHGTAIRCEYTSMAQCAASASGRPAQCLENPYFGANKPPRRADRRQQRVN